MQRYTFIFIATLLGYACTTTKSQQASDDFGLSSTNGENAMVFQAKSRKPVIAKVGRDQWIQIRKSLKPGQKKLMATLATGSASAAATEARAFLKLHPKDRVALSVLSLSLAMQRQYAMAGYYAKLLERYHQQNATTANLRGMTAMLRPRARLQDFQEAIGHFQEAFNNDGQEIASGLNLGRLHLETGDAKSAAAVFAMVKDRCDQCLPALLGSGVAHSRLRNYAEAQRNFEKVLDEEPKNSKALYRLALLIKVQSGPKQEAKEYLARIVSQENIRNQRVYQKAQSFLRQLEAEMARERRTEIADEKEREDQEKLPVIEEETSEGSESELTKGE